MDKEKDNHEENINITNIDDKGNRPSKERLSKETIDTLYGDEYKKISLLMKDMENNTKKYFKEVEEKLMDKFREFNANLENYFVILSNKLSEAFGFGEENIDEETIKLIQNNTKKNIDKIIKMKNIHEQILESIKMAMSILFNSLDIAKILDKDKPIREFLEKEFTNIVNSWLFVKLDFENFNLTKTINNSNLDDDFKEFIYKVCQNNNFVMNIGPIRRTDENLNAFEYEEVSSQDSTMITENFRNLTKMKINKIRNADYPFQLIKDFPKLRYLKFNNCSFSDQEEKNSLIGKCTKLEKLIINGAYNFESTMLQNFSKNLTKLILSNNNFVNSDFENIMRNYIIKSDTLKNTLELLSFNNNSLSKVDLEKLVYSSKHKFRSLKELDFHKNRITKFSIDPVLFPVLKCINCCHNKFSRNDFGGLDKIIVLLSGNLFLTEFRKCQEYYTKLEKQLKEQVKEDEISLPQLTLSYLPNDSNNFAKDYLEKIVINNNILIHLKKLNLSYNNLTCDTLFTFIQNNKGCINLKVLNLCGNKLDDTFFERYLEYNYHNIFTNLKKINLNDNLIGNDCEIRTDDLGEEPTVRADRKEDVYKLRLIYKFIEKNKNLSKLYLTKNPMCEKSVISKDVDMNDIAGLMIRDEHHNIVIDSFYSFLKKIMDELLTNKEEKNNRGQFNVKFDINTQINLNSESFNYKEKYIMFN